MTPVVRLALVLAGLALPVAALPQVNQASQVTRAYQNSETASDGSSSSANGHTAIIETLVADRADGTEWRYDLPPDTPPDQRAREWALPAQILRAADGKVSLLNEDEVARRRDAWMDAAELPKSACGTWYFTWNAFKIECDPASVLTTVAAYALPRRLAAGAPYTDDDALAAGVLKVDPSDPNRLTATVTLDPERIRKAKVESDLVVAEITRTPLARVEAEKRRAEERISGTRVVTFEQRGAEIVRKVEVTRIETVEADGTKRSSVGTVTLTRQPAAGRSVPPDMI